jgi:hypothetical protein
MPAFSPAWLTEDQAKPLLLIGRRAICSRSRAPSWRMRRATAASAMMIHPIDFADLF